MRSPLERTGLFPTSIGAAFLGIISSIALYQILQFGGSIFSGQTSASSSSRSSIQSSLRASSSSSVFIEKLCGNATLDPGEQCDLGYRNGIGTCTKECKALTCGDGIVTQQLGEECEPIRVKAPTKDPISNTIIASGGYLPMGLCGTVCAHPVVGPDGKESGGCRWKFLPMCLSPSSAFVVISSSSSSSEKPAASSSISSKKAVVCGDGVKEAKEQCDQGSQNSNTQPDACRTNCALARCGDGVLDPLNAELCDKGGLNSNTVPNACRTNCKKASCGDGVIDLSETCDGGLDCTPDCTKKPQPVQQLCGNGKIDGAEKCDDRNQKSGDGCSSTCTIEARKPVCGNGRIEKGELCDDGAANSDTLPDHCRLTCKHPVCGDHIVDAGEQCDDGNLEQRDFCMNSCLPTLCGNGIVEADEQCDDGNKVTLDGCAPECRLEVLHAAAPKSMSNSALFLLSSLFSFVAGVLGTLTVRLMPKLGQSL